MKKKLTDNMTIKIISLVIGFIVWLLVANVDNPIVSRSYTLSSVELVNEAYIDDTGMVCLWDQSSTQVRVTITGTRMKLSGISSDDITLTADLQQAVSLDTDPVMIPIIATCNGISSSNISVYPQNISVHLEEKVTSEFMVSISTGDTSPGSGYDIGSQVASPEKVRITGPESLVNKIDKVVATVKLDGRTSDRTDEAALTVLDKNGDTLSDLQMSNLKISNDGKVSVTTTLWKTRSDIALDIAWFGIPAEGYIVSDVSTVPTTVTIAGSTEGLEILKEAGNVIRIEDETVDVSEADNDMEFRLSLSEFLPEETKLTTGTSDEILVTVSILPDGSQKFSISTSAIKVENLPENLQVAFDVDKVEIRVISSDDALDISDFDVEDIEASIDVTDMDAGSYEVPVNLVLPDGYDVISEVATEVTISEISVAEESTQ